jgi:pimeloyl-ACP methyl ester carboxylesterase
VSTPRSLRLPPRVTGATIGTTRGRFAALVATPVGGVAERQPALLVPGFTGSKEDFIAVLDPLAAAGRSVTAIDMRGQFQSPPGDSDSDYRLDQLGADLVAVTEAVAGDRGRAHLLGHSFGGLAARDAVLATPAVFQSLTLLGSGPATIGGARAAELRELLDHLEPAGSDVTALRALLAQLWEQRLGPQAQAAGHPDDIIAFLRERMLGNSPVGLTAMARQLLVCPDRTAELAELAATARLPILVSYGENDDAWPPSIQDLMAKRLGAECVCIPAAGHSPAVEAPETTAAALTAFWNRAESGQ